MGWKTSYPTSTRPASRGPGGTRRKTQEIILSQLPRPASRASGGGSSAYFDDLGGRRGYELSRSPSETSTTSTIMSDMSSVSSRDRQSNPKNTDPYKAGKCPHCYIHSWLPHSPQCPRKKWRRFEIALAPFTNVFYIEQSDGLIEEWETKKVSNCVVPLL